MEGSQGRVDAKDVPSGSKFTLESAFHPDAREKSYCHPGGLQPMTKLELLYAQKSKKFDQLCILAARELGYGELSTLSTEDRIRVEDEATQYVEQWEEAVEMKTNFTTRPITPLRRLLAEYHDICERILDEHEIDAGLWAYRKRAQKRRRPVSL
jgi:hypothetical protein